MRSDTIKRGFSRAPHRALLRATGQIRETSDFDKPFIAVCNSYVERESNVFPIVPAGSSIGEMLTGQTA